MFRHLSLETVFFCLVALVVVSIAVRNMIRTIIAAINGFQHDEYELTDVEKAYKEGFRTGTKYGYVESVDIDAVADKNWEHSKARIEDE